jgi:hypothetical protein
VGSKVFWASVIGGDDGAGSLEVTYTVRLAKGHSYEFVADHVADYYVGAEGTSTALASDVSGTRLEFVFKAPSLRSYWVRYVWDYGTTDRITFYAW